MSGKVTLTKSEVLDVQGWASDVYFDNMSAENLVAKIQNLRDRSPQGSTAALIDQAEPSGTNGNKSWIGEYESTMTAMINEHARQSPAVALFISEVLDGRRFTRAEDARKWVESIASQYGGSNPAGTPPSRQIRFPKILFGGAISQELDSVALPTAPCPELERLKALCLELAGKYGWSEEMSTITILTTLSPVIDPCAATLMRSDIPCLTRIRIDVDPNVPPEQVAEAFRKKRSELKSRWHRLSLKHMALAKFTIHFSELSWKERWERWNDRFPQFGDPTFSNWAYRPALPVAHFTKEEKQAIRQRKKMLKSKFKGTVITPDLERGYPTMPVDEADFERRVESAFATFRRDASRARRRLLDPHWSPAKREEPEDD